MAFALSDMKVTSSAFEHLGRIPDRHTQSAEDVSPPLAWSGAPDGTKSFAVICVDPDAPLVKQRTLGWVHWVLYGLPASMTELEEGTRMGVPGRNDSGESGYRGPKPPEGHGNHHYYYWVLALDTELDLPAGLDMPTLLERVEPHLLGMNRLVGIYHND